MSNAKQKSTMPFRFTNHSLCLCASPKAAQAGMHHEKGTVPKLVCLQGTFCEARAPTHASLHMQSPRNEEPASIAVVIEDFLNLFQRKSSEEIRPGPHVSSPAWSSTAISPRVIPASTISGSRRPRTWIRSQDQGSRLKHYRKKLL